MSSKFESLQKLVLGLQDQFSSNLDRKALKQAIKNLRQIDEKWKYESDVYPDLVVSNDFDRSNVDRPSNLAEAFIWKQRDYKKYAKFVEYVRDPKKRPKDRLSHYAFAMHVGPLRNPITDQHALRALWILISGPEQKIHSKIKRFLTYVNKGEKKGHWKEYGSSTSAFDCYSWYVEEVRKLLDGSDFDEKLIDSLLMPLGKALRSETNEGGYAEFCLICGWKDY